MYICIPHGYILILVQFIRRNLGALNYNFTWENKFFNRTPTLYCIFNCNRIHEHEQTHRCLLLSEFLINKYFPFQTVWQIIITSLQKMLMILRKCSRVIYYKENILIITESILINILYQKLWCALILMQFRTHFYRCKIKFQNS